VWHEHVVALEDGVAIELDGRKGVQAVEGQDRDGAILGRFDFWKVNFVNPRLISDPFSFKFIESKKGVGYSMRALVSVMPL
jgi:hypothetical protein